MKRAAGILLPVFSLPGDFGIGSFSIEAYRWIDCLKEAGQSYWQILPLGPTGYGDSPYQSFSSFAGNPYFIDLEELKALGLLTEEELSGERHCGDEGKIDYGHIYESREKLLRLAHRRFRESLNGIESVGEDAVRRTKDRATYQAAVAALHPETGEYCLYRAVKDSQGGKSYLEWEAPLKERDSEALRAFAANHEAEIDYYVWTQVLFHEQWSRLKEYALAHGITIIGDLPIYVAPDSADAWAHPELFQLDEEGKPEAVAGCPPDYFSPDGQLWGNPLYDWDYHKRSGYAWWARRMEYSLSIYDCIRMDHFRGFDEYFAIPAGKPAKEGSWKPGPGVALFKAIAEELGKPLPIIAEDLGFMTESVIQMVKESGFPPMKVLEFAYDSDNQNIYLPHRYERNCVAYTGTHDNEPLMGWIRNQNEAVRLRMLRYQGSEHTPESDLYRDCIRTVLASVADTVVIPMWDYLGCGNEARINVPSTAGGNWQWRMPKGGFTEHLIWHCRMLTEIYGREPEPVPVPAEIEAALAEAQVAKESEEPVSPEVAGEADKGKSNTPKAET